MLNNVVVKSILGHGSAYEVDQAENIIFLLDCNNLLIFDRGYAAYPFMASLIKQQKHFIIRCPKNHFTAVQQMFSNESPTSKTVLIDVPNQQKKKVKTLGLADTIKIRLIRIILPSGEVEVLATSLLDENEFSEIEFKHLYSLRWGVETFFSKIKGRLALENFTGKTVESIYQDFWSTIFISNLETIMTEDLEKSMNANKSEGNQKLKINKAVSFNSIKNMAFEIFFTESDKGKIFDKLMKLFVMNPVIVRENRQVIRRSTSDTQSLNFQQRMRKHVF